MSVMDAVLSRLDAASIIILLLVFLIGYYWLTTPRNLPPGPPGLPVVGNLISLMRAGPNILDLLRKWRQQYGDVFTLRMSGDYMIVISSYKMLHEAFVKQGDVFSGRPTNLYTMKRIVSQIGPGLVLHDGGGARELRRATSSSLRDFGVGKKSLEQRVQEEARAIVEVLDKSQGQPVSLAPLLGKFFTNVICSVVLGNRFDYDDAFLTDLIEAVNRAIEQQLFISPVNTLPLLRFVPPFSKDIDTFVNGLRAADDVMETTLAEHEETYDPGEVRDFVDLYIKNRKESNDSDLYSAENMRRVIVDLVFAGTDSTSATMDWIILYLVAHPEVQKRCQQDVDRVIGQGRLATVEDRKDLPYIQAVITETMRIATVAPLGIPHRTEGEAVLGGYKVPANTIVLPNLIDINLDPTAWLEPDVFKPGRFLDNNGHFCPPKDNFVPFSIGPRMCLGEWLSRMEIFIVLTTLVQTFTFTMPQDHKADLEGHFGAVYSARPQPVLATRR